MPKTPPKRQNNVARRVGGPITTSARRRSYTGNSVPESNPVVETIDLTTSNSSPAPSRPKKNLGNIVITVDLDTSSEITSPQPKKTSQVAVTLRNALSPDVIEVAPTPTVEKVYPLGDCPICFDVLGKNPLASTRCGHVFCEACLRRSLTNCKQCPTCRKSLKGSNSFHPLFIRI